MPLHKGLPSDRIRSRNGVSRFGSERKNFVRIARNFIPQKPVFRPLGENVPEPFGTLPIPEPFGKKTPPDLAEISPWAKTGICGKMPTAKRSALAVFRNLRKKSALFGHFVYLLFLYFRVYRVLYGGKFCSTLTLSPVLSEISRCAKSFAS